MAKPDTVGGDVAGDGRSPAPILEALDVERHFTPPSWFRRRAAVRAVDGIDLRVEAGQTVSIVGESGCGKTTLSRLLLGLDHPTSGEVRYFGEDIQQLPRREYHRFRRSVQAVFQDPWSSLNPRMRVSQLLGEPLTINRGLRGDALEAAAIEALESVGLDASHLSSYPHEFSGGMRQRLAVARAVSLNPDVIVLDEPVSALDVSVRAQVMNLLKRLQTEGELAYVVIAHDLATVRYLSDTVCVMYLGQVVEIGPTQDVFNRTRHPYTQALVSAAVPDTPGVERERIVLQGEVPSPSAPPPGCRFHTRCPLYRQLGEPERCRTQPPDLALAGGSEPGLAHRASCHFEDELAGESLSTVR